MISSSAGSMHHIPQIMRDFTNAGIAQGDLFPLNLFWFIQSVERLITLVMDPPVAVIGQAVCFVTRSRLRAR